MAHRATPTPHVLAVARPYAHRKRCSFLRIRAVSQVSAWHRTYPDSVVAPETSAVADASSRSTGQYPARDRLARPCVHRSDFPEAVELRLGKIR